MVFMFRFAIPIKHDKRDITINSFPLDGATVQLCIRSKCQVPWMDLECNERIQHIAAQAMGGDRPGAARAPWQCREQQGPGREQVQERGEPGTCSLPIQSLPDSATGKTPEPLLPCSSQRLQKAVVQGSGPEQWQQQALLPPAHPSRCDPWVREQVLEGRATSCCSQLNLALNTATPHSWSSAGATLGLPCSQVS